MPTSEDMQHAIPRRSFLAATVGAGLAATTSSQQLTNSMESTSSLGASLPPLSIGIIGTGSRGLIHIGALSTVPGVKIAAICDVDERRLATAARRAGESAARFLDCRKLLEHPGVDAVLIATPNLLHREMVLAAIDAGKHVACEKPMATTLEDCRKLVRAAEKAETVVMFTMQLRYAHRYAEVRKYIEQGCIGTPKFLWVSEFRGDWNPRVWMYTDPKTGKQMNWRHSQVASGGTLNEKCCHYFDILHWLVGETPVKVGCSGDTNVYRDGRETWDHAVVSMDFAAGARADMGLCMYAPHQLGFQIIGDKGMLTLPTNEDFALLQAGGRRDPERLLLTPEVGHGERGQTKHVETALLHMYDDFRQCIQEGKPPLVDARVAMASCQTAFRAQDAAERRCAVEWEPTE